MNVDDKKEEINKMLKPMDLSLDSTRTERRIARKNIRKNIKRAKNLIYKLERKGYSKDEIRDVMRKKYKIKGE